MKIAVTYDNGTVFQHFGRTENFKVYEVEDGKIMSAEVRSCGGTGHEALADLLKEWGVSTVLCGGLGGGAKAALSAAGIEVVSGTKGDCDEAAEAYLAGELVSEDVNCDHDGHGEHGHGEEGGCGHHGEDGGCGHHGSDGEGCGHHGAEAEGGCGHHDEGGSCCGGEGEEGGCGGCGGGCCGGQRELQVILSGKNAGKLCRVHYVGTLDDGSQFDSSYDRGEPLEFICGTGMMISGFDKAVCDMETGASVDIHLAPEEAYGMPNPNYVIKADIVDIPGSEDLAVGDRAYLEGPSGRPFAVRVADKTEDVIVLDANHELAGKTLNFHIELLSAEEV